MIIKTFVLAYYLYMTYIISYNYLSCLVGWLVVFFGVSTGEPVFCGVQCKRNNNSHVKYN